MQFVNKINDKQQVLPREGVRKVQALLERGQKVREYEIINQLSNPYNREAEYYLCRTRRGRHMIMQVCQMAKGFRKGTGYHLAHKFDTDEDCLVFPKLYDKFGTKIQDANYTVFVLEFDVKDVGKLIPLKDFFTYGVWFDLPTTVWMMRELEFAWYEKKAWSVDDGTEMSYRCIYPYLGGILVDPEYKLLVVYDCFDSHGFDYDEYEAFYELCEGLLTGGTEHFAGHEVNEPVLEEIGEQLSLCRCDDFDLYPGSIFETVRNLADELKVDEKPFGIQDKPLAEKRQT